VSKAAGTKRSAKKKAAKKRPMKKAGKKTASKSASRPKPRASVDRTREVRQEIQGKGRGSARTASSAPREDFEGLSRAPEADSESVAELVEEGNLFEAGAVAGVEEADNADEREVHTHEVPEDDVPEEYLDKD
jgi:hypothetical protein